MNTIVLAIIIVSAIGLIAGIGLSIASKVMAVPIDEKAEKIREVLPGANCGACGFSGCDGYAAALSGGEAEKINLCSPGGDAVAAEIAEIMGVKAEKAVRKVAMVRCAGTCDNTSEKMDYHGIQTCQAAKQLFGGAGACTFGCMGLGDCAKVCPKNAIHICNGVSVVDPELCIGCGECAAVCPKGIIDILTHDTSKYIVRCSNKDKGMYTMKVCKVGCIGCGLCAKNCESQAITVENNLAKIDPDKCIGCGKCKEVCPKKSITSVI